MILGYYVVNSDRIDEHEKVRIRKNRFDRLKEFDAPSIIMDCEQKALDQTRSKFSTIQGYRESLLALKEAGTSQMFNTRYQKVYNDADAELPALINALDGLYEGDLISSLLALSDDSLIEFIKYSIIIFDLVSTNYAELFKRYKLEIAHDIIALSDKKNFSDSITDNIEIIDNMSIRVSDCVSHHDTLITYHYDEDANTLYVNAINTDDTLKLILCDVAPMVLQAKDDSNREGIERLDQFYPEQDYNKAFFIMNEAVRSYMSLKLQGNTKRHTMTPVWTNLCKIITIVTKLGKEPIPMSAMIEAYLSNDFANVRLLFEEINSKHDEENLLQVMDNIANLSPKGYRPIKRNINMRSYNLALKGARTNNIESFYAWYFYVISPVKTLLKETKGKGLVTFNKK